MDYSVLRIQIYRFGVQIYKHYDSISFEKFWNDIGYGE